MKEFDFRSDEVNYIIFTAVKGLWAYGFTLDDLLNEARVGVWEASKSWNTDGGSKWTTYAVMIARRKVIDMVSTANTQKNRFLRYYAELETSEAYMIPEESFEYNESKQILFNLLEKVELTELEQQVLELRLQDYGYAEIANRLNLTYKSVDNTQQRILKKLKNLVIPAPETLLSSQG